MGKHFVLISSSLYNVIVLSRIPDWSYLAIVDSPIMVLILNQLSPAFTNQVLKRVWKISTISKSCIVSA